MNTTKIAISLPRVVASKVELLRKETGESRSALLLRAIERVFDERDRASRAKAYADGYRRLPETPEDHLLSESAVAEIIAKDPWD